MTCFWNTLHHVLVGKPNNSKVKGHKRDRQNLITLTSVLSNYLGTVNCNMKMSNKSCQCRRTDYWANDKQLHVIIVKYRFTEKKKYSRFYKHFTHRINDFITFHTPYQWFYHFLHTVSIIVSHFTHRIDNFITFHTPYQLFSHFLHTVSVQIAFHTAYQWIYYNILVNLSLIEIIEMILIRIRNGIGSKHPVTAISCIFKKRIS